MGDIAPSLGAGAPEKLGEFVDRILSTAPDDPGQASQHYEEALEEIGQFGQDPDFPGQKALLEGFSFESQGCRALRGSEFAAACAIFEQASDRFTQAGAASQADLCAGLQLSAQACAELLNQNFGAGQKLISDAQKLLHKDPKLGLRYAPLIDQLTISSLGLGAAQAAQAMDLSAAKVMSEEASLRSADFARKYCDDATPMCSYYLGLAKYWRAFYQFSKAQADLQTFSFQALIEEDDLARTAREARALLAQGADLPGASDVYNISGFFAGTLEALPSVAKLANALVQGLPAPQIDYNTLQAHLKTAQDAAAASGKNGLLLYRLGESLAETIENLRRFDLDRPRPMARPADPRTPIQVFVIMPFAENSKVVEQALRTVLEDDPYWFRIMLARDSILSPNLLDNVKEHMHLADAFVADISGLNPNVMMELGMVEGDPAKRPVFVLKRKAEKREKEPDVPSDLKAKLYIEYEVVATASPDEKVRLLANELRTKLTSAAELTALSSRPHTRFTSAQYIQHKLQPKKMQLGPDDIAALQKGFPCLEDLEAATSAQIAMKTGLDEQVAGVLVGAFACIAKQSAG
jgi:hypothetical protein